MAHQNVFRTREGGGSKTSCNPKPTDHIHTVIIYATAWLHNVRLLRIFRDPRLTEPHFAVIRVFVCPVRVLALFVTLGFYSWWWFTRTVAYICIRTRN